MTLIEKLSNLGGIVDRDESVVSLIGMKWQKRVQKFQMKIFVWLL